MFNFSSIERHVGVELVSINTVMQSHFSFCAVWYPEHTGWPCSAAFVGHRSTPATDG